MRVLRIGGCPLVRFAVSSRERLRDVMDSAAEVLLSVDVCVSAAEVSLSVDVCVEVLLLFGEGHSSVSELSELADGASCGEGCVFGRFWGMGVPFHISSLRSEALRCLFHVLSRGFGSSSSMKSFFWVLFLP